MCLYGFRVFMHVGREQGVHETVDCEASPNEWAPDGSDRESKIVFIGLNLDKDYITKSLKECLVPEEEK